MNIERTVEVNVDRVVSASFRNKPTPIAVLLLEDERTISVCLDDWHRAKEEPHSYIPAQPGWTLCTRITEEDGQRYLTPPEGDAIIGWQLPNCDPVAADPDMASLEDFVIVSPDGKVYQQWHSRWDSWEDFAAESGGAS
tara:strand:+ start:166566 stop:166982 length:417 start_codon:yes stop_codon:yes gene_type:complete